MCTGTTKKQSELAKAMSALKVDPVNKKSDTPVITEEELDKVLKKPAVKETYAAKLLKTKKTYGCSSCALCIFMLYACSNDDDDVHAITSEIPLRSNCFNTRDY